MFFLNFKKIIFFLNDFIYDKFYFLCIVKKKSKKKVFEEKFGTLGENDVIEKMLMSSYFFAPTCSLSVGAHL